MRTFAELDERLVGAQPGVMLVRAPADAHGPITHHASRRLRTSGWLPIGAAVRSGAPLFREVALHLGVASLPCDPALCAETLASAAVSMRAAIVAPLPKDGTWDRSVAAALARVSRVPVVFLSASDELPSWDATTFEVAADLNATDKLRWLSAVADEAQSEIASTDIRSLEAWWSRARRAPATPAAGFDDLGPSATSVLTFIALAGRSLSIDSLSKLEPAARSAIDELVAADFVSITSGLVSASPWCELATLEADASHEERIAIAKMLDDHETLVHGSRGSAEGGTRDAWAHARAAALFLTAGAHAEADAAMGKALRHGADPQVNGELSARWFAAVGAVTGNAGLELRLKSAQRALLLGEAADAQRWCESAATIDPTDPTISLLMARALMQLGDLVAARVCLSKAESNNVDGEPELAARVAAERAELSYLTGELELAASHAVRAADLAKTAATRLGARGTLGKILLARGSWELADEHFAEDAMTASSHGETTAELRARLNRGIALLSKGRLDEAREILERVLADGTRLNEERARAYALSNLGLVAYRQHDYGSALQYWERTVRFPQALRGRLATALTIANLADLRLRLGLVDHAEHAISFGRKLLSGHAPPRCAALFKWVSAQVALAKRNTELARREIEGALVDAQASGDHDCLESAYIVSARVALEDGDLARASQALATAESIAKSGRARAEIAIVRAMHRRALGQPALEIANQALQAARLSGDEDLLTQIHALLAVVNRDADDMPAAHAHCARAIAVRDQVANGLPADIRAAYLSKPEMIALARFQTALANERNERASESADIEEVPRTQRAPMRVESGEKREIVGDDPQMKTLAVAIKKVAKSNSTVLIRGESGTGKELVAEALHRASDRANGPLVSVNCAALVETLLLSELFGHEKGAFTGASARRRGRFEMAEGGTLFLDEIGDISPRTQVALLRVLQEKTFERVGGTAPIRANVRVVCATHRDLRAMVERGEFREDLYYRLRGITLEVPALRARISDLPKIADHLLARIAEERNDAKKSLSSDAVDLLQRHRWPGNIRELENVLRAVSLFADGTTITMTDLIENVEDLRSVAQQAPAQAPVSLRAPLSVLPAPVSSAAVPMSVAEPVDVAGDDEEGDGLLPEDEANATAVAYAQVRQGAVSLSDIKRQIERDCIARALTETKGNITRAAALLGMKRPRLSQLVKQYGLAAASSEGNS
jgi:transcriptional regulator with GAF, ATPase, and Fis domain/tetratricopeptide (TPR) repeat protein